MEELEKYLNNCYIERDNGYVFVYKLVKREGHIGLICHETEAKPVFVAVYEDFPEIHSFEDVEFLKSFIPELDNTCNAKVISEEEYYNLTEQINKLYSLQEEQKKRIKDFVYGLGEKV